MKTIITLEDNNLPVIECEIDGVSRKFSTTFQSILESISNSFYEFSIDEENPDPIVLEPSPSLPLNTVKYGRIGDDGHFIVLDVPASQHDVQYHTTNFKKVGFPNMLFVFKINKKSIQSKSVFCYKDKFIRDTTELFAFPYANVFEGGSLCFYPGNYEVEDLVQLQTFPHMWFSTQMNDHAYNPARHTGQLSLRELLQSFENKPFDNEILCKKMNIMSNIHKM